MSDQRPAQFTIAALHCSSSLLISVLLIAKHGHYSSSLHSGVLLIAKLDSGVSSLNNTVECLT